MATYVKFDKDNVILPSFVKNSLVGQKKRGTKMSTARLEKLIDAELMGNLDEFAMPELLQEPIEFKATPAHPQLPHSEGINQNMAEKKIHDLQKHLDPRKLHSTHRKKDVQEIDKKSQKPQHLPVYQAPPPAVQLIPQIFHTEYAWYNGTWVPVHHHVALVPQYLM